MKFGVLDFQDDTVTLDDGVSSPDGEGTLKDLLDDIATTIKAITGQTNWYDTPDFSFADIASSDIANDSGIGESDDLTVSDVLDYLDNKIDTLASSNIANDSGIGESDDLTLSDVLDYLDNKIETLASSNIINDSGVGESDDLTVFDVLEYLDDKIDVLASSNIVNDSSVGESDDLTLSDVLEYLDNKIDSVVTPTTDDVTNNSGIGESDDLTLSDVLEYLDNKIDSVVTPTTDDVTNNSGVGESDDLTLSDVLNYLDNKLGSGDMSKSVYDTDDDGSVNLASAVQGERTEVTSSAGDQNLDIAIPAGFQTIDYRFRVYFSFSHISSSLVNLSIFINADYTTTHYNKDTNTLQGGSAYPANGNDSEFAVVFGGGGYAIFDIGFTSDGYVIMFFSVYTQDNGGYCYTYGGIIKSDQTETEISTIRFATDQPDGLPDGTYAILEVKKNS